MRNSCKSTRNLFAKPLTATRNKARKLRVTALSECRLTYLQFAGDFTRGVMIVLPGILVFLSATAGIFARKLANFVRQIAGEVA